jgi:hypothetical protein
MGPSWQVENALKQSSKYIPPTLPEKHFHGITAANMTMKVPEDIQENGQTFCDDIVKVFITSRPTFLDLLELPKIGKGITEKRSTNPGQLRVVELADDWAAFNFFIRTIVG